jgi:hypothetical protein
MPLLPKAGLLVLAGSFNCAAEAIVLPAVLLLE